MKATAHHELSPGTVRWRRSQHLPPIWPRDIAGEPDPRCLDTVSLRLYVLSDAG